MKHYQAKLGGMLVLIAGIVLCLPQVGSALSVTAAPPRMARAGIAVQGTSVQPARTISPSTTAAVELIPPLVIHPPVRAVATPAKASDPALPVTGSSQVLVISLLGLCLIGSGLLLLVLQSLGSATKLAVLLHQIGRRMA